MTTTQRRIRHLRLVAGSQAAVRSALPRIEDALRCASLPDVGERLLLVRRLALGALEQRASPQEVLMRSVRSFQGPGHHFQPFRKQEMRLSFG